MIYLRIGRTAQTLYRYETASSFAVDFTIAGDAQVITAGDESYVLAETWQRSIYSSVTAIIFAQDPNAPDPPRVFAVRSTATSSPSTSPRWGTRSRRPRSCERWPRRRDQPGPGAGGRSPLSPGQSLVTDRHHHERLGDALLVRRRGARRHAPGDRSTIAGPVHLSPLRRGSWVTGSSVSCTPWRPEEIETAN